MSSFENFQKQKDAELEYSSENTIAIILICFFLFGFPALILIGIIAGNDEEDACADIGGTYQVVGEEFSPAHKTTVDVYGCVK